MYVSMADRGSIADACFEINDELFTDSDWNLDVNNCEQSDSESG
jgi:hypothetical protein